MSDKLTLDQLRIPCPDTSLDHVCDHGWVSVSIADWVEVGESLGAFQRQWHGPMVLGPRGRPDLETELPPGTYLIYRIEEDK